MSAQAQVLRGIRSRLGEAEFDWVERAAARAASDRLDSFLDAYTDASRRLGNARFTPAAGETVEIDGAPFRFDRWTLEDAGRLALLLARHRATSSSDAFAVDALACFERGDTREQLSWLRGVALLPDPARYLPTVIDACRTNILPLFEAVACDNPYAARHFPERNFNQMVMKALFNGVPLDRIAGLATRANAELARMAEDFTAERRAAGRAVPADIGLAMTHATHEGTTA